MTGSVEDEPGLQFGLDRILSLDVTDRARFGTDGFYHVGTALSRLAHRPFGRGAYTNLASKCWTHFGEELREDVIRPLSRRPVYHFDWHIGQRNSGIELR